MFWPRNPLEYLTLEQEAEIKANLTLSPYLTTPYFFPYDNFFPMNYMIMASQPQIKPPAPSVQVEPPKMAEAQEPIIQVVKIEES